VLGGLESPTHLLLILLVALLVFGGKRLPGIGRQLGTGMREFKEGITGEGKSPEVEPTAAEEQTPSPPANLRGPTSGAPR
jgi:sec-independent protein translocase protein TatA